MARVDGKKRKAGPLEKKKAQNKKDKESVSRRKTELTMKYEDITPRKRE